MKLRVQLIAGSTIVLVLMVLIAGICYQNGRTMLTTQDWIRHKQDVVAVGYDVQSNVVGMQSAKRGYLLSGDEQQLERFGRRRRAYATAMAGLKASLGDDPDQAGRVIEIASLVEDWLRTAGVEIATRRQVARGKADIAAVLGQFAADTANLSLFNAIDDRIDALIAAERAALEARNLQVADALRAGRTAVFAAAAMAILLGIAVMYGIARRVVRQVGGEPAEIAAATAEIVRGNLDVEISGKTGIAASVAAMGATMKDVARQANAVASGDYSREIVPRSDKDELGIALCAMGEALRAAYEEGLARDWLKTGLARFSEAMQGDPEIAVLAGKAIGEVATRLDAKLGLLYVARETDRLELVGSYAHLPREGLLGELRLGEGLVGQAAKDNRQILLEDVPDNYLRIASGLGEHAPSFICVTPFSHDGRVQGVIELGTLREMSQAQRDYLQQVAPILAVAVETARARARLARALAASQQLTDELQSQQEELRVANEELEEQTQRLRVSEARLKAQKEELRVSNEELEEKNQLLERQKRELEGARKDLSAKAAELALASKYKSQFLANMSHELRTPLNSLLLLAQNLAENKDGNLTGDQVEAAQVIHDSGRDLLSLINEILDLSKIEAGRMDLDLAPTAVQDLAAALEASFRHMAQEKGLAFDLIVDDDLPDQIVTDRKRLDQILRNLVSNALKFTECGSVTVTFARPPQGADLSRTAAADTLAIAVKDTGIGIPADKHQQIFAAFEQGDGTTTRRYGGTGLGLTISRELAALLGGEIRVESTPGEGATFTLYIPCRPPAGPSAPKAQAVPVDCGEHGVGRRDRPAGAARPFISDDRDGLAESDWTILVIEDDLSFAAIIVAKCHENGLKCIAAPSGEAGLELIARYRPKGVILDIRLPGRDGIDVLSALKEDLRTRHIPVHVVSVDEDVAESLSRGAIGHAVKPLDQESLARVLRSLEAVASDRPKRLLMVEGDPQVRRDTIALVGGGDLSVDEAVTGAAALAALRNGHYHCLVLNPRLPDMSGQEFLERLAQEGVTPPPVVVYPGPEPEQAELDEEALHAHAGAIALKDVHSPERLLDEVSLFLHRVVSAMPEAQRAILSKLYDTDAVLRDKQVLVVDDDMRTTFVVARLLGERGMRPLKAENGEQALRLLDENPDVDLVLVDLMMPVMDGYETMERIRAQPRFRRLPIIVLTAKAMPEDRARCLAAGANDYLSKPLDAGRLFSLMRVWLHR